MSDKVKQKFRIIEDLSGTLYHDGRSLVPVDKYTLFLRESGWDGWANLDFRGVVKLEIERFLQTHQTDEYVIEVECKDGKKYQNRVRGESFYDGDRPGRLVFKGLEALNLAECDL